FRVAGDELPRRELVGFLDGENRLHGGKRVHRRFAQPVFVADTADDGAADSARDMWRQAERRDVGDDLLQVVLARVGSQDDDHAMLRGTGTKKRPGRPGPGPLVSLS